MNLTNDVAERVVKLVSDILTTDSKEREKLILAVQKHRRDYKQIRKKDLMRRIGDDNKIKKVAEVDFDEWYVDESDDSDD